MTLVLWPQQSPVLILVNMESSEWVPEGGFGLLHLWNVWTVSRQMSQSQPLGSLLATAAENVSLQTWALRLILLFIMKHRMYTLSLTYSSFYFWSFAKEMVSSRISIQKSTDISTVRANNLQTNVFKLIVYFRSSSSILQVKKRYS